jgi:AcrR family transcriptional regulator
MKKDETTESRILTAAKKVFLKKGMDGARMQDIADEAGINKAMLHYYFRSKEKLFQTIFLEVVSQFFPKVSRILETDGTVFEKIEMFCAEYINQVVQTPYVPMFVMNEINRQPKAFLQNVITESHLPIPLFVKQLQKETKEGIIRPVKPEQLLLNIISLCLFPFIARPMLQMITGMEMNAFNLLMEERKKEVPRLITAWLRK